jgi:hypothetical protein
MMFKETEKSTLLFSWLNEQRKDHCLVSWVSLDETDQAPLAFWKHILYSIDEVKQGSVTNTFSWLKPLHANNNSVVGNNRDEV